MKHLAIGCLILAFCLAVGMPSEAEIDPEKAEAVWLFDDGAGGKVVWTPQVTNGMAPLLGKINGLKVSSVVDSNLAALKIMKSSLKATKGLAGIVLERRCFGIGPKKQVGAD